MRTTKRTPKIPGRVAASSREETRAIAKIIRDEALEPTPVHVCWSFDGKRLAEFYLGAVGDAPAIHKRIIRSRNAEPMIVATGRIRCREMIRLLTFRYPSELGIKFPKSRIPETPENELETPEEIPS